MKYEIDPDAQRHPDENDINLGQVHFWKFIKGSESGWVEPDVYVKYGSDEWICRLTTEDYTCNSEMIERFIRELRRVNNT